MKLQMMNT